MQINSLFHNYNICTHINQNNTRISFFGYKDSFDPENQSVKKSSTNISKKFSELFNKSKTNIWLSVPLPTKRNIIAFLTDNRAFTFEINRPFSGKIVEKQTLGQVDLIKRKDKTKEKAFVKKVEFDDDTAIYYIQKGLDRLGFIDVDFNYEIMKQPFITYASTIVGRDDYRNLFGILIQALTEDCIVNRNFIPEIMGEPGYIGSKSFSREALYKYYGAKSNRRLFIDDNKLHSYRVVSLSPQNIIKKFNKISDTAPKKFILGSTQEKFEELKQEYI